MSDCHSICNLMPAAKEKPTKQFSLPLTNPWFKTSGPTGYLLLNKNEAGADTQQYGLWADSGWISMALGGLTAAPL